MGHQQRLDLLDESVAQGDVVRAALDLGTIGVFWVVVLAADGVSAKRPVVDAKLPVESTAAKRKPGTQCRRISHKEGQRAARIKMEDGAEGKRRHTS